MRIALPVLVLSLGTGTPLAAQEAAAPTDAARMAERMADPAAQQRAARTLRAMAEVVLDMPVAPLADALGEMGAEVTGAPPRTIAPDTTLRKLAPGAGRVPEAVERMTPQMMRAMGAMARGLEAMKPELEAMARRVEQALPPPAHGAPAKNP